MASEGAGIDALRVVLLGKTGAGKSSLGNSLTKGCHKLFKVGRGLLSETKTCDWSFGAWGDFNIEVTDTPGLIDTHLPDDLIYKEVGKSVAVATPGPHIFIFVARCDRRFTAEEREAFNTIQQMFPGMDKFLIIVFLGLDTYYDIPTTEMKRQQVAQELATFGEGMNQVLEAANNRYIAVMNKVPGFSQEEVDDNIRDLVRLMVDLVRQNGNLHYTNAVITEINSEVEKLTGDYSEEQHLTPNQAIVKVREAIVNEEVDPGFFSRVSRAVKNAIKKMIDGVKKTKDACSIM